MNKTYKLTGLFVLIGLICFGCIVGYFVKQKFTENEEDMIIMYFDESIRGLSVGSPILLQGVEIGNVAKIRLLANLEKGTFKTPVYMKFNDNKSVKAYGEGDDLLEGLIKKGLRARLITSNFLTGQLMIELVMDDKTPAVYRGTGKYPEIPTIYSPFAQISKDLAEIPLQDTIIRIGNLIDKVDDNIPLILDNMSKMTSSLNDSAPETIKNLNALIDNLNKNLPDLLRNVNKIASKIDDAIDNNRGKTAKTMDNVNNTLEEISKVSRSMKNLTDYLERHPEAIVQGKGK